MKKSTRLAIILVGLVAFSLFIALSEKQTHKASFDTGMFAVADTAGVVAVEIKGATTNRLEKKGNSWEINDTHVVDPNTIKVLQTILAQVSVKRPVARLNNDAIVQELRNEGHKVTLFFSDGSERQFWAGGDAAKKNAFFADDERAYVVAIPGYNNYISGIFELTASQWRDRLLFASTWRTLQSLTIDYEEQKNDLTIAFEDDFLKVQGVNKLDTTALMDYVQQYAYFQINDYLPRGKYPRYEALTGKSPKATISLRDIDETKNKTLTVYPLLKGESFYLVTDQAGEMMVIDARRMENLLVKKDQFISE